MGGAAEGETYMKFIVGSGEQLRNRLETFPKWYKDLFSSSKILVICVASDNDVAGACSIAKISNYALTYVKEEYRGRGLGTRLARIRMHEARRRGLGFMASTIGLRNLPMLRVGSKVGYREVVRLRNFGYVILMTPFTLKGELLYMFLRAVCSRLPETFLDRIIVLSMNLVGWVRRRLGAS